MPTLIRSSRAVTPLQRSAQQIHRDNAHVADGAAPAPADSRELVLFADPADLPADLLYRREQAYAMCMAVRMETWLAVYIAEHSIPADSCARVLILLPIYVEAMLKARIVFPGYFPRTEVDEEDEPVDLPWDEDAAAAEGLSVYPAPTPRMLPAPTLPGCQGEEAGGPCEQLRRYGARYCPHHEREERQRIRRACR